MTESGPVPSGRIATCPSCNGQGAMAQVIPQKERRGTVERRAVVCNQCAGTGRVQP